MHSFDVSFDMSHKLTNTIYASLNNADPAW